MDNISMESTDIIKEIERFYDKSKEGFELAKEAVGETVRLESDGNVSSGTGEMDWHGRDGGVRTIGVGISTEFIRKGYIDLRGKEVRSPRQLAVLAQVFRDPRFETLRFFYMKGNKIVGHEGITSKLPLAAAAIPNLPEREDYTNENEYVKQLRSTQLRFFMDMLNRMERLKSDGYYLLHGHPSGFNVTPSNEDAFLTASFRSAVSGFKGHIIIDSNKYGFIDKDLNVSEHKLNLGEDLLLKPSKPHYLLGAEINSSRKLAMLAKTVQLADDYSVVIYVSSRCVVRAIQEVPDGLFKREKECVDYLRGRMCDFGSTRAFLVTRNQHTKEFASGMVKKGYLLDAVIAENDYRVTSVREKGLESGYSSKTQWMGISINKGYRVRETDKSNSYASIYTSKRTHNPIRLQKNKSRLPEIGI